MVAGGSGREGERPECLIFGVTSSLSDRAKAKACAAETMSSFARNFAASLGLESNLPNISHPSKKGALLRASLGRTQQIIDRELGVANSNQLSREDAKPSLTEAACEAIARVIHFCVSCCAPSPRCPNFVAAAATGISTGAALSNRALPRARD
jgi:hypothetical protein